MRSTRPLGRLALAAALTSIVPATPASSPQEIWNALRSPRLDPARAVRVEALEVDMGPGGFRFEDGVIIPAVPVGGRTMEIVFLGRGSFRMDPPDAIEAAQLELFTGSTSLDVPVDQVVLVVASEDVSARLLQREAPATLDPDLAGRAERAYATWAASAERRGFGAEGAMLKAAVGDARLRAYFAAQVHSSELGNFYYVLDPSSIEQATLGQFVPIEADYLEEARVRRALRQQQRKGRLSQLRFDDLGEWDTWVSTSLTDDAGEKRPGSSGFEAEHYELSVTISPKEKRVGGRARLRARAVRDGLRVVTLEIFPDLKVTSVQDASGRRLPTFRSASDCHVILAEPTEAGRSFTLEIEFGGVVLEELDSGIFELQSTATWYPRLGDDRATYDVSLRWPKNLELLAAGRRVDGGVTEDGAWEKRTVDLPTLAYSFEIGAFDVHRERVGHVDLTVGFSKAAGTYDTGAKAEVLATLRQALPFYEERFGAYPLDYLTVATVPRGFSQGFLGFLTLSHHLLWTPQRSRQFILTSPGETVAERRKVVRIETVAHELAHQWWGNRVGWVSYRDQWLSEALANYSATWFTVLNSAEQAVYLARHSVQWQQSVNASTREGRRIESLGPIVLGTRLSSSKSASAYSAIVYDKGAVVLSMLDRGIDGLGQPSFADMLRTLAEAVNNRLIDTPTFLKALERMSGADLGPFAAQFIYGTGMPEIHYTYDFKQEGDGWVVEGEAEQISRPTYRYRLLRMPEGRWDVKRIPIESKEPESMALIVPFQISLVGAVERKVPPPRKGGSSRVTMEKGLGGSLTLRGPRTSFSIPTEAEPRELWLDQRGEVLALFQSEKRRPKFGLKRKGSNLANAGRLEEAEVVFRQALAAKLMPDTDADDSPSKKDVDRLARRLDVEIHLALTDLYTELGRDAAAKEELETAEDLLTRMEQYEFYDQRLVLEARLALRAGDHDAAYALLSKYLRLDFPVRKEDDLSDVARRQKFRSGRRMQLGGDAYAMLAAAAHETGHPEVAAQARSEGEKLGAEIDLSPP